ncbi:MAG: hypothetical protein OXU61_01610 [Gammaproteobacteria bacterium]|nr:hypothetical protein [Gammaproteobacteria bacterium]
MTRWVMVAVSSVVSSSGRAMTVTVWASFQFVVLKIRAPETVTSSAASGIGWTVTSPGGMARSTTV